MCNLNRQLWLSINLVIVSLVLCCTSGCMNPYYRSYGYGAPYSGGYMQPNYAPQPGFNSTPGSLYIPENPGAPYPPGSLGTYEDNPPRDDFLKSNDGKFFEADDVVPQPQPLQNQLRRDELGRPQARTSPNDIDFGSGSGIQQVSGISDFEGDGGVQQPAFPTDNIYGFDMGDYRSLTGVLRYDQRSGGWAVTYSLKASDRYAGTLPLALSQQQAQGLSEGDNVEIFGQVDDSVRNQGGRPVYRVTSITRI